jgi:hypothetical protein
MSLVLVEGQLDVVYYLMLPTNYLTELLVSRLVQISVRPEKALLQKSLRASKISPVANLILIFSAARPKLSAVKSPKSIQSNSKTPTMNMASSQAPLMNRTMKRPTKYMMKLTRTWTHGVGHAGVFSVSYIVFFYSTTSLCLSIQGGQRERRTCQAPSRAP